MSSKRDGMTKVSWAVDLGLLVNCRRGGGGLLTAGKNHPLFQPFCYLVLNFINEYPKTHRACILPSRSFLAFPGLDPCYPLGPQWLIGGKCGHISWPSGSVYDSAVVQHMIHSSTVLHLFVTGIFSQSHWPHCLLQPWNHTATHFGENYLIGFLRG